jgi:hypothetical protein
VFDSVVVRTFQIIFYAKIHVNDVFLFFKNYFWQQHIKTIQNIQTIINFNKKNLNFLETRVEPRSQTLPKSGIVCGCYHCSTKQSLENSVPVQEQSSLFIPYTPAISRFSIVFKHPEVSLTGDKRAPSQRVQVEKWKSLVNYSSTNRRAIQEH